MQIVVRMPGGAHLGVNLNSTCSINELKEKISEMDGVPVENQRLLFCSKELSNEETLEDGSVLDMEFALLGGIGPSDIADHLKELAHKYKTYKMICRSCYARLPLNAHNCRKRKCGHCANIRPKKKIK